MRKTFVAVVLLTLVVAFTRKPPTPYPFPTLLLFPPMPAAPDNPVTVEGAALGRMLFYDPILSVDSSMSCGTCHRQEAAFSDAPFAFSSGRDKQPMPRNTPTLFNLAWYQAFFWDGKATSLEEQVFHPVRAHNEMNLVWKKAAQRIRRNKDYREKFEAAFGRVFIDSVLVARAIAQFERTLLSYRSKYDKVLRGDAVFTPSEANGLVVMNDMTKGDCLHCHTTDADALGTTRVFSNNGLDAVYDADGYKDKGLGGITGRNEDNGKFKIPTLRNIALTGPYMHDGRFATLEDVIAFYSDGVHPSANVDSKMEFSRRGGAKLSLEEQRDIVAFLHTLTDSAFVTDPAYGNPFVKR